MVVKSARYYSYAFLATFVFFPLAPRLWAGINACIPQHEQPIGRYTERQILALSRTVCQDTMPGVTDLQLSASHRTLYDKNAAPIRYWQVECTNSLGEDIGNLLWMADTGKLRHIGRNVVQRNPTPEEREAEGPELNGREAVQKTRYWLQTVGRAEGSSDWKVTSDPERTSRTAWTLHAKAEGRQAIIKLDAFSGNLLWIKLRD